MTGHASSTAERRELTLPAMVVFDLDETLAPSRMPMDVSMARALLALIELVPVAVIGGGQFRSFERQLLAPLTGAPEACYGRLHLMPSSGARHYTWDGGRWVLRSAEDITEEQKRRAFTVLEAAARSTECWEDATWGPRLEDRGSQVSFSALGQAAPRDLRRRWDPTGAKRERMRRLVASQLPDLEVHSAGATSIDVTAKGIDKAFGMRQLARATGIGLDDMLFVGDSLHPGGNDHPVLVLGVECRQVACWQETRALVLQLVVALRCRQRAPVTDAPPSNTSIWAAPLRSV